LQDISCKMRDAGFDVSFRDSPAKGGTGGHPIANMNASTQTATSSATTGCTLPPFLFIAFSHSSCFKWLIQDAPKTFFSPFCEALGSCFSYIHFETDCSGATLIVSESLIKKQSRNHGRSMCNQLVRILTGGRIRTLVWQDVKFNCNYIWLSIRAVCGESGAWFH
jgi:hypothetical protein